MPEEELQAACQPVFEEVVVSKEKRAVWVPQYNDVAQKNVRLQQQVQELTQRNEILLGSVPNIGGRYRYDIRCMLIRVLAYAILQFREELCQ